VSDPIDVAIQAACLAYLKAANIAPGQVAYPYVAFSPTVGTPYLDARPVLRAAPNSPALAFTGSVLRAGIFQVDAVAPDGGGEGPGLRLAAQVAALFPQGLVLAAGGFRLQFNHVPTIAAALKDAAWVRFPVSIPYLLISNN